jgi:lipoprotein NlpD
MIRGLKILIVLMAVVLGLHACTTMQTSRLDVPVVDGVMHTVHEGETVNAIAKTYEVSSQLLIRRNNLREGDVLDSGARLFIPGSSEVKDVQTVEADTVIREERDGLFHTVGIGETLIAIAAAYDIQMEEIQRVNNIHDPSRIYLGQELWIPRAKEVKDVEIAPVTVVSAEPVKQPKKDPRVNHKTNVKPQTTESAKPNKTTDSSKPDKTITPTPTPVDFPRKVKQFGDKKYQWPIKDSFKVLRGYNISSSNASSRLNHGIDLGVDIGTEVCAAADGEILLVGGISDSLGATGLGNHIIIDHGERNKKEIYTLYAHNSQNLVKSGQKVKRGQVIAKVGNTGHVSQSAGGVLHFEVREQSESINPLNVLPPLK